MGAAVVPLIGAGASLLGGAMQSSATKSAAKTSSDAQIEAARIAAEASRFKPVGVTTGLASSYFGYGGQPGQPYGSGSGIRAPSGFGGIAGSIANRVAGMSQFGGRTGDVTSAGYTLNPYMQQISQGAQSQALGYGLPFAQQMQMAGQGMFGLGQQFMPQSAGYQIDPGAMGMVDFMRQQAAMSAPMNYNREMTPEAQAYQQQLYGMASRAMPQDFSATASPEAQGLFNQLSGMAGQVMPQSYDTQAAAQDYMRKQQALLQPGREQQLAQVRQGLFNKGRQGLAIGGTTGAMDSAKLAATNPEMAAYYNAMAQQDAALGANAEQIARGNLQSDINLASNLGVTGLGQLQGSRDQTLRQQLQLGQFGTGLLNQGYQAGDTSAQEAFMNAIRRGTYSTGLANEAQRGFNQNDQLAYQRMIDNIKFGSGLMGDAGSLMAGGYKPLQAQLGLAQTVEGFGMDALNAGAALGGRVTQANQTGASLLNSATSNAATTMQNAAYSPMGSVLSGLGSNQQFLSGLQGLFSSPQPAVQPLNTSTPVAIGDAYWKS